MGHRLLFDDFELRLDTSELRREGRPVKLQRQPAHLLGLLASHSGEVVSRDEIRRELWGEDAFLEVESAINFAIRQIRRALSDSATEPRFVETLPRLGYRFLPAVRRIAEGGAPAPVSPEIPPEVPPEVPAPPPHPRIGKPRRWHLWATATALLVLLSGVTDGWMAGGGRLSPVSKAAYEAYLEGIYLAHAAGWPGSSPAAIAALERATTLAPDFAPAWGRLALARFTLGHPAAEVAEGVEAAAREALRLDPGNADAHVARGELALFRLYDLERARAELERAVGADPGSARAHLAYAEYLAAIGAHERAIAEAEEARKLDPVDAAVRADLVWFHYLARHYDEAIAQGRIAYRLDPTADPLYGFLSIVMKKEDRRALDFARMYAAGQAEVLHLAPPPPFARLRDFWTWRLAWMERRKGISPGDLAIPVLALGDRERALGLFEEACRRHSGWMLPFLSSDPLADPLRGDPRFARLLRCAGHPGQGA